MHTKNLRPHLRFIESPDGDNGGVGRGQRTEQTDAVRRTYDDGDNGRRQEHRQDDDGARFTQEDVDRILGKRLAQERKEADREVEDLRKAKAELDRIKDQQKTEAERQAEALEEARRQAEQAKADAIRYRAAAAHGIGEDYLDLLGGDTEETVKANAERLGDLIRAKQRLEEVEEEQQRRTVNTGRPRPRLRPGSVSADEPRSVSSIDEADAAAARRGRTKQGDTNTN